LSSNNILLEIESLRKYFPVFKGVFQRVVAQVKAVDGIDLFIREGETLGLVGESGCGKSTTGRTILQLYRSTAGKVFFEGINLADLKGGQLRRMRRRMQMLFQDPYASLNPRMTVGNIIGEPLEVHQVATGKEQHNRVQELLALVGLNPYFVNRYPHEFSGGQRQRIAIARALITEPAIIALDEAVSALDMSVRARILDLLAALSDRLGVSYLFVTHDLSVLRSIADRVLVMKEGRIVEQGATEVVFATPSHPYTMRLLGAAPDLDRALSGRAPPET